MTLTLLGVLLLGAPDALVVLEPPAAPGVLRDQVWPAFATPRVGAWRLRPIAQRTLSAPIADAAGALWAEEDAAGTVRLHRVLFAAGTHLVDRLNLPADAAPAAVTDAVRLRLRFILESPPTAGRAWEPPPPPLPPPFVLPEAHRADLALVRAPPVPKRVVRIPAPPPPLNVEPPDPPAPAAEPPVVPSTEARPLWIGLGADGLVDQHGGDVGLGVQIAVPIGARVHLALAGALHPFHDYVRAGRPLGVSVYRATVGGGWRAWERPGVTLDLRGGLGLRGVVATGSDTEDAGWQPALSLSAPLRIELRRPFALALTGGLLAAPSGAAARHASGELLRHGAVQLRAALGIEVAVP